MKRFEPSPPIAGVACSPRILVDMLQTLNALELEALPLDAGHIPAAAMAGDDRGKEWKTGKQEMGNWKLINLPVLHFLFPVSRFSFHL